MSKKIFFIGVGLLVVFSSALWGQASITDTIDIGEVIVTGTKTAVHRSQVPATISVIQQKQIEQSAETSLLPILSEQVPGLFITERGVTGFGVAGGAAGQISMRGIGGAPTTQVLILLNGNPQYMGIMGHPLADAYRSSNIERVEVIRGPGSMLYGSNAMGGVINIITKEQKHEGASFNGKVMYGSYNTLKVGVNAGIKKSKLSLNAGINYDRTDGHREASYFNIIDGYFKAGYEINQHLNLSADISLAQFNGADPGIYFSDSVAPGDTLDILRGMGAIVLNNKFEKADGSLRLFYNFGEHDITTGFFSNDFNYGLVAYENFRWLEGNTITLGFDYKTYGGKAENLKFGSTIVDTTMNEVAGYLSVKQQLFDKIALNAGARVEQHSVYGKEWVPSFGATYQLKTNTTVKGSASKGFRSPTIRELFIRFPFPPFPNPNLEPENIWNYELTVDQKLINDRLSFSLTGFKLNGENLIQGSMNTEGAIVYKNAGKTDNTGIEMSGSFMVNNWLSINSNYTFIDMKTPVLATPTHKFYIGSTGQFKKLTVQMSFQHINGLYNAVGNTVNTENYSLLNTHIFYQIVQGTSVFMKGENLLNQEYAINQGYPMPGATFFGGVRFSLNK